MGSGSIGQHLGGKQPLLSGQMSVVDPDVLAYFLELL